MCVCVCVCCVCVCVCVCVYRDRGHGKEDQRRGGRGTELGEGIHQGPAFQGGRVEGGGGHAAGREVVVGAEKGLGQVRACACLCSCKCK